MLVNEAVKRKSEYRLVAREGGEGYQKEGLLPLAERGKHLGLRP